MTNNDHLQWALGYARMGWHVFPVGMDKAPLTGKGHLDASSDPAVVEAWWQRSPEAGIGLAVKPSGIVVLDVDVAKDKPGRESFLTLADEIDLPKTMSNRTGSGGLHLLYSLTSEDQARRFIGFRDGLDLLGDGYIILPPSQHASGGRYQVADSRDIAPVPEKLIAAALSGRHKQREAQQDPQTPIPTGARSDVLCSMGGGMRNLGFTEDQILIALESVNDERCEEPLDGDEVERIAHNMARYKAEDDAGDLAAFIDGYPQLKAMLAPEDECDFISPGVLKERADNMDHQDCWIIPGWIPRASPAVIAGPPKSHKSFFALFLAVCMAAGKSVWGVGIERSKVCMVIREDGVMETIRRLQLICRGMSITLEELEGWLFISVEKPLYLDNPEHVEKLYKTMGDLRPEVLFIDNLSRVHVADENDRTAMVAITHVWADLCERFSMSVVMIHHYNKSKDSDNVGARMRGSGDLFALVRVIVGVEKTESGKSRINTDGNLPGLADPHYMTVTDVEDNGTKMVCITGESKKNADETALEKLKQSAWWQVRDAFSIQSTYTSKNAVFRETGGNKVAVLYCIDTMIKAGILSNSNGKILKSREARQGEEPCPRPDDMIEE